jgi:hypothetical protein
VVEEEACDEPSLSLKHWLSVAMAPNSQKTIGAWIFYKKKNLLKKS